MPDYQNGVIYVIYVSDLKYVGSTVNLQRRKQRHHTLINYPNNKGSNRKLYKAIRENGGGWRMEIYKKFPCGSKQELLLEEERIRKELGAELNERCCATGLIKGEYDKQYMKQYHQDNKEKACELSKKYREQNKELVREKKNAYYQNNKEKICKRNAQKIECPICGLAVSRVRMARHQRTAKCKLIAEQRAEEVGSS